MRLEIGLTAWKVFWLICSPALSNLSDWIFSASMARMQIPVSLQIYRMHVYRLSLNHLSNLTFFERAVCKAKGYSRLKLRKAAKLLAIVDGTAGLAAVAPKKKNTLPLSICPQLASRQGSGRTPSMMSTMASSGRQRRNTTKPLTRMSQRYQTAITWCATVTSAKVTTTQCVLQLQFVLPPACSFLRLTCLITAIPPTIMLWAC